MNIIVNTGYECHWRAEVIDSRTGKLKQVVDWNKNLIVDAGIAWRLANTTAFIASATTPAFPYIAVGTGTTAPANGDTTLETEFPTTGRKQFSAALSTLTVDASDVDAPFVIIAAEFGLSDAIDSALSECGLFTASSGGTMFCRDLFKDGGGTPITIDKSAYDYLRVYCKITAKRLSDTYWSQNVVEASTSKTYACKGIVLNSGLAACLSGEHWDAQMIPLTSSLTFGDDNTTAPAKAQTAIQGGAVSITNAGAWQSAGANSRAFVMESDFTDGTGVIKEAVPGGSTGKWRMTFDETTDDGLDKDATNYLVLTITYTIARV